MELKEKAQRAYVPTENDSRRCCAKSKQTGQRCGCWAVPGKKVCRFHGGRTPTGTASPHFKTGRYCRYLPDNLAAKYEEGRRDPELLGLREEVAVMTARFKTLLSQLVCAESGVAWRALHHQCRKMNAASKRSDLCSMRVAAQQIGRIIERGAQDELTWRELDRTAVRIQRLSEAERRRQVEIGQTLRVEEAMTLAAALLEALHRAVDEQCADTNVADAVMKSASEEFRRLLYRHGCFNPET